MRVQALRAAVICGLMTILAGIAASPVRAVDGRRAAAPRVVVSLRPLDAIAAAVMEGAGEPDLLLSGAAATPHGYSLKPSQMRALNRADIVFWVGPELETFLKGPLAGLEDGVQVVPLLSALRRHAAEGRRAVVRPLRTAETWDKETAAPPAGPGEAADPHIWLDPVNGAALADIMAEHLARADPGRAELFKENARRFGREMVTVRTRTAALLEPVKNRPFIVYHDSYQYLERRFGLKAVGAVSGRAHVTPGAARLSRLHDMLKDGEAVCVFVEPQFPPRAARMLVRGTHARLGTLDPLGSGLPAGPNGYALLFDHLAGALTGCLEPERRPEP